ncbi:hypothetical protein Droror1_Dr00018636 [Drosera rotundifolia]
MTITYQGGISFKPSRPLSPMGEACSRMDLTAIHQILVMTHYRDDEGSNELSFQEWTQQMKDVLEARKRDDYAFRDKDFRAAIECYSQSVALAKLVMQKDAIDMLNEAAALEEIAKGRERLTMLRLPCPLTLRRLLSESQLLSPLR